MKFGIQACSRWKKNIVTESRGPNTKCYICVLINCMMKIHRNKVVGLTTSLLLCFIHFSHNTIRIGNVFEFKLIENHWCLQIYLIVHLCTFPLYLINNISTLFLRNLVILQNLVLVSENVIKPKRVSAWR